MKKYIVVHGDNWAVRDPNAKEVSKILDSQKEAIIYAASQKNTTALSIQGKDGKFRRLDNWDLSSMSTEQISGINKNLVKAVKIAELKQSKLKSATKPPVTKKPATKKATTKKPTTKKPTTKKPVVKKKTTKKPVVKKKTTKKPDVSIVILQPKELKNKSVIVKLDVVPIEKKAEKVHNRKNHRVRNTLIAFAITLILFIALFYLLAEVTKIFDDFYKNFPSWLRISKFK